MATSGFGVKAKLVLTQRGPLSTVAESVRVIAPVRMFSAASSGNDSSSTSPGSSFLVGERENIVIDGSRFESLPDHVARLPPVSVIPPGGLITVMQNRQLQSNDGCRFLLWTGFLNSLFAKKRQLHIINPYDDDNIGVIKEQGILAFKSLVPAEDGGQNPPDHCQYIEFVKKFLCKCHGPSSLNHLPDWERFVQSAPALTDDQMLYHSVFFQDEDAAALFFDLHRLVRHQFFARGLSKKAVKVLGHLSTVFPDPYVVRECTKHFLLKNLLGVHEPVSSAVRLCLQPRKFIKRHPPGSAVVDTHRIAVAHCIETALLTNIRNEFPNIDQNLLNSYVRKDVIRLLRYLFPLYIQTSLDAFWPDKELWDELDMSHRLPIPSIFSYSSPKEEVAVMDSTVGSSTT